MSEITKATEWEGEFTRLVKLGGLKRHANFPYNSTRRSKFVKRPNREIEALFMHQLAGPFRAGVSAAKGLARFATGTPKRNADGKRIGGGRGWPGMPYTFLVPYYPEVVDGKFEVYRLWDDEWVTWHTGRGWNKRSVAVGFAGMFKTRKSPKWSARVARDPEKTQFVAGTELVTDYLMPRYGLTPDEGLKGHFDAGKSTCPGDILEAWIRMQRGENVNWLEPGRAPWDDRDPDVVLPSDKRSLDTWMERQQALVDLGYYLGSFGPNKNGVDGDPGEYTHSAVKSFQHAEGLVPDAVWGPNTELVVRLALAR